MKFKPKKNFFSSSNQQWVTTWVFYGFVFVHPTSKLFFLLGAIFFLGIQIGLGALLMQEVIHLPFSLFYFHTELSTKKVNLFFWGGGPWLNLKVCLFLYFGLLIWMRNCIFFFIFFFSNFSFNFFVVNWFFGNNSYWPSGPRKLLFLVLEVYFEVSKLTFLLEENENSCSLFSLGCYSKLPPPPPHGRPFFLFRKHWPASYERGSYRVLFPIGDFSYREWPAS